jgi:hypothetical protein
VTTAPGIGVDAGFALSPVCDPPLVEADDPSSRTAKATQAWKSTPMRNPTIANCGNVTREGSNLSLGTWTWRLGASGRNGEFDEAI